MKYCAVCGNEISNPKKRKCSYCGADLANPKNVIERDVSIPIKRIVEDTKTREEKEKEDENYLQFEATEEDYFLNDKKEHRKLYAFLLQFFVGFTGASFFYLGFYVKGIIWLILNILMGVSYLLIGWVSLFLILLVNAIMALIFLFLKTKDKNGLDLI